MSETASSVLSALTFPVSSYGTVTSLRAGVVEATGLVGRIGDPCTIDGRDGAVAAEVLSVRGEVTVLAVLGSAQAIRCGDTVRCNDQPVESSLDIDRHYAYDGHATPLLQRDAATCLPPVRARPRHVAYAERAVVTSRFMTGIPVLDDFLPIGRGQRLGVFAEAGCGKTTLLRQLISTVPADHTVVAMVGERAREARELTNQLDDSDDSLSTTVFLALAGDPPTSRIGAFESALATAQTLADVGQHVLLVVDSMTRFAFALREIDLANGEPMTHSGMTPTVFRRLSETIEMTGALVGKGSITLVASVLMEGPSDDSFSSYLRSLLDGHIYLSRSLADRGVFPAVDLLNSRSRLDTTLLDDAAQRQATQIRNTLADYRSVEEYISFSGYDAGSNEALDGKIRRYQAVLAWLQGQLPTNALELRS
ncbi:MAG: hypothetical protein AAF004_08315 [Pseudomonadota bacterium]